jgi:hypothetical protein
MHSRRKMEADPMTDVNLNVVGKKYYRMNEKNKPNEVISRIEKSTARPISS